MTRSAVAPALALVAATVLAGCDGSSEDAPLTRSAPTSIAQLDVAGVRLARAPFCDRLTDAAVREAVGGPATSSDAWTNGDPVPTDGSPGQVGHEFGCSWTGADGLTASAWVFARPVSPDFATTVVRGAGRDGCSTQPGVGFGSPALVQTCPATAGLERVRRAGLFGDTWLTCEVTGPASVVHARVDRWCATTVSALDIS
jgi:hypothetical protein